MPTFQIKGFANDFGVFDSAFTCIFARGALASLNSPLPQILIGDGVVAYVQAVAKILRPWRET